MPTGHDYCEFDNTTKNYTNMETQIKLQACENRLQKEAAEFLTHYKLRLNGLIIQPTEIEVYYYREGEFEDKSVHQNELQQNNYAHFYIHRWGKKKDDAYKGGNRPGIDFVVSKEENVYYTFLIRSAVINNSPVVGPHKVLMAIQEASRLADFKEIENAVVEICPEKNPYDVVFSQRINLGKTTEVYMDLKLRAVLCDDTWFIKNKYRYKEQMIIDLLSNKQMAKEESFEYTRMKLGYIPLKIRNNYIQ